MDKFLKKIGLKSLLRFTETRPEAGPSTSSNNASSAFRTVAQNLPSTSRAHPAPVNKDKKHKNHCMEATKVTRYLNSNNEKKRLKAFVDIDELMNTLGFTLIRNWKPDLEKLHKNVVIQATTSMESYLRSNPLKNHPVMTAIERQNWLLIAYMITEKETHKLFKPLRNTVIIFIKTCGSQLLTIIDDPCLHVRKLAVDLMKLIVERLGLSFFKILKRPLLDKIGRLLNRPIYDENNNFLNEASTSSQVARKQPVQVSSDCVLLHCLKSLTRICQCLGEKFVKEIDEVFLELIYTGLAYPNAMIRHHMHDLCLKIVDVGGIMKVTCGFKLTSKIIEGLSDRSSPVRTCSLATVQALLKTLSINEKKVYYAIIVPPLRLSCHYIEDSKFRISCRILWRQITNGSESEYFTRYIESFAAFYTKSLKSKHLPVQLAAASSITTLATEVDKNVIDDFMPTILDALKRSIVSSNDRQFSEALVSAVGAFILSHPDESQKCLDSIFQDLLDKLGSSLPQARRNAAFTIGKIVSTYGKSLMDRGIKFISSSLSNVYIREKSSTDSQLNEDLADNNYLLTSESNVSKVLKNSLPVSWEKADGALYLIAELNDMNYCYGEFIPQIIKALENRFYKDHITLYETTCRIMPSLVPGLGDKVFKRNILEFLDIIYYVIESSKERHDIVRTCLTNLSNKFYDDFVALEMESYNPNSVLIWDFIPF